MKTKAPLTLDMLRRGDAAAVRQFSQRLVRMARRYIPPKAEAESVAREAMVDMLAQLAAGKEPEDVTKWMWDAVSRAARRSIRRYKRYPVAFTSRIHTDANQPRFSAAQHGRTQLETIHSVMQTLPEATQEAIVATAVDGRTTESVATQLGTPSSTVRNGLHRARRKFQRVLSNAEKFERLSELARQVRLARVAKSGRPTPSQPGRRSSSEDSSVAKK